MKFSVSRTDEPCRLPATKKGRCRLHGGASGSGGPPGERNGQYCHGERTKTASEAAEIQRIAENAATPADVNMSPPLARAQRIALPTNVCTRRKSRRIVPDTRADAQRVGIPSHWAV